MLINQARNDFLFFAGKEILKILEFIEETLRDGQQSLWANRMKTEAMLPIAPTLDKAGFSSINIMSGSAFESCIMYLREDPWERLRLLRQFIPKTDIRVLIRGRTAFGWRRFPDDAIELLIKCLKKVGIQELSLFDGLNDLRNLEAHIKLGKQYGIRANVNLVFTVSPVHTDEYYAQKVKECVNLGVKSLGLSDASGLLTPERSRTLITTLRAAMGNEMRLAFDSHCSTGLGAVSYVEALRCGVDAVAVVSLPLAYGNSMPCTMEMINYAREMGFEVGLDEELVRRIDDYFFQVAYQEKRPKTKTKHFSPREYEKYCEHQIPGGMMSHLISQLKSLDLGHRLAEVLEEAGRVRMEIGFPVMVTPFSQIVGVQAVFNVVEGERYRTVPLELRLYARGFYGELAAPIDPNVLDRILADGDNEPIDPRANDAENLVERFRVEQGPFASDEELLLFLFYSRPTLEKYYQKKKPMNFPILKTPLKILLEELGKRSSMKNFFVMKKGLKIVGVC